MLDEVDLLELASNNDFDLACAVASSRYSTEPILDISAHDRDERIRLAAVTNTNCGIRTLEYLQKDSDSEISMIAKKRLLSERNNQEKIKWYCKKGYHGEHNFGHGDNYLSSFLFTLNLLAFVFHTILELADPTFQNALKRRVTHKNLFQHLQSITEWMVFDSWDIVFALISIPKNQKISASKFIEFLHSC
jgi:hypothetical protein